MHFLCWACIWQEARPWPWKRFIQQPENSLATSRDVRKGRSFLTLT